jgi:hypothetical protein
MRYKKALTRYVFGYNGGKCVIEAARAVCTSLQCRYAVVQGLSYEEEE